jgi:PKD domain
MRKARARRAPVRFAAGLAAAIAVVFLPAPALAAKPSIGFDWVPGTPAAGESVLLTAAEGTGPSIASWSWDFDGDRVADAVGPSATATFATPGPHVVRLEAIATNGKSSTAEHTLMVGDAVPKPVPVAIAPLAILPAAPVAATPSTPARAPTLLTPFPIVRIQGTLLPGGVIITRLTVWAPAGSRVRGVCRGPGCPRQSVIRRARSAGLPVRLRPLERRLRVGAVLEVFVTGTRAVGKYTRFVIRRGALPVRLDRCVAPAGRREVPCPRA